jgi:hypothetical protein
MVQKIKHAVRRKPVLSQLNDLHTLIAWYQDTTDSIRLTPKQEEMRNRIDFCDNLIRKYGGRSKVIPMLEKHFRIGKDKAERLFNHTQTALNSQPKATKDYWRDVVSDWASEYRDRAILEGNLKAEGDAVKIMMKVRMLDREDAQNAIPEMPPQTIIIEFQQHTLGLTEISEDEARLLLKEMMKPKRTHNIPLDIEETDYDDIHP